MTSLEFIEKQIDVTKKQLAKYPLSKEQSDPNYKHKEADIQYVHNKYYTEQLQTLQQIKSELEAWEVVKKHCDYQDGDTFTCIPRGFYLIEPLKGKDYQIIKKALEVEKNGS
jgi:hypothetical protein